MKNTVTISTYIYSVQVFLVVCVDHLPEQSLVDPLEVDHFKCFNCLCDPFDQLLLILVQLPCDLPLQLAKEHLYDLFT
jgi:hypothetical protein